MVEGCDFEAVAGHADVLNQALVAGFLGRFQRAVFAHDGVPVVGMAEVVKLDEVDLVHAHPFEGAVDLRFGGGVFAFVGLCGQEEAIAVFLETWPEQELGVAVAGGGIDVVDAVIQQQVDGAVGIGLADAAQRGGAEERDGAVVAGAAERALRNHRFFSL